MTKVPLSPANSCITKPLACEPTQVVPPLGCPTDPSAVSRLLAASPLRDKFASLPQVVCIEVDTANNGTPASAITLGFIEPHLDVGLLDAQETIKVLAQPEVHARRSCRSPAIISQNWRGKPLVSHR
jgi:hypothetical protein